MWILSWKGVILFFLSSFINFTGFSILRSHGFCSVFALLGGAHLRLLPFSILPHRKRLSLEGNYSSQDILQGLLCISLVVKVLLLDLAQRNWNRDWIWSHDSTTGMRLNILSPLCCTLPGASNIIKTYEDFIHALCSLLVFLFFRIIAQHLIIFNRRRQIMTLNRSLSYLVHKRVCLKVTEVPLLVNIMWVTALVILLVHRLVWSNHESIVSVRRSLHGEILLFLLSEFILCLDLKFRN